MLDQVNYQFALVIKQDSTYLKFCYKAHAVESELY